MQHDATTPHIAAAWRDAFVLELRLIETPGERIGDELATVDSHLAESGESAVEAFGDPRDYARSLVPAESRLSAVAPRTVAGVVLGLLALLVLGPVASAGIDGTPVLISGGDVASYIVVLALAGLVLLRPSAVLGPLFRVAWVPWVAAPGLIVVLVVGQLLWRDVLLEVPWPLHAGTGIALLTVSTALTWPDLAGSDDPISDPRSPESRHRRSRWLLGLLYPLLAVVVVGIDLLFRLLG